MRELDSVVSQLCAFKLTIVLYYTFLWTRYIRVEPNSEFVLHILGQIPIPDKSQPWISSHALNSQQFCGVYRRVIYFLRWPLRYIFFSGQ